MRRLNFPESRDGEECVTISNASSVFEESFVGFCLIKSENLLMRVRVLWNMLKNLRCTFGKCRNGDKSNLLETSHFDYYVKMLV